jgi:superfamily II DNA helicase RecQ
MEAPHHTISEREAFRRVSIEWHRFLQFASSQQPHQARPDHMAPEIQRQRTRRLQALERMDLRAALRVMVDNEHAEFRGQQEEALQAIVHRATPVVLVTGTSVGKSAVFMLPAVMSPHGLTIVVVPVISLRQDLAQRCTKAGIQCVEWHARQPADGAQIVLVTPESMVSDAFQTFMNRQRALGVLDRIIVDEAHMILECEKGWRMTMRRALEMLAQYHVQVAYLTATLEPSVEDTFYRMTGIAAAHVRMIRGPTTRGNIAYQVRPYDREHEEDVIQATVEGLKRQYPLPGQIIVYCHTVEQTESLARLLGCQAYHRHIGSDEDKRDILRQLVTGQQHVFTATNALGLGIDRGSIRVVMHVGVPRQMRAYAQESGRAGRDGLASEAIIMRPGYVNSRGQWRACGESEVQPAMRDFIQGQRCRRVVLDHRMDGRIDRIQCEMGEEVCDICRRCRPEVEGEPEVVDEGEDVWPETEDEAEDVEAEDVEAEDVEAEDVEAEDVEAEVEDQQEQGERCDGIRRKRDIEQVDKWHNFDDINSSRKRRRVEEVERSRVEMDGPIHVDTNAEHVRQDAVLAIQRARRREESQQAQQLEAILDAWQDRCPLCVVCQEVSVEHRLADCGHPRAGRIREHSRQARGRIRFQRFAACWDCGLPQETCESWVRGPNGRFRKERGKRCQYGDSMIFEVYAAVLFGAEDERGPVWAGMVQAWIREDEGAAATQEIFRDEESEWLWYGQKIDWGGIEASQFVRAFYRCAVVAQGALERYIR